MASGQGHGNNACSDTGGVVQAMDLSATRSGNPRRQRVKLLGPQEKATSSATTKSDKDNGKRAMESLEETNRPGKALKTDAGNTVGNLERQLLIPKQLRDTKLKEAELSKEIKTLQAKLDQKETYAGLKKTSDGIMKEKEGMEVVNSVIFVKKAGVKDDVFYKTMAKLANAVALIEGKEASLEE